MANNQENGNNIETGIETAVIGMAGRFPRAGNINELWELLKNGVEAISFFSADRMQEAGVSEELLGLPNYVKAGAFLEDKEYFDAAFFGYSPKEAGLMDPQMRLFHQCCWEGLEDAGYDPVSYGGAIGLYAGAANSFYWEALSLASGGREELGGYNAGLLTNSLLMTTHISHKLDLKGPTLNIFTTCSTSLVAVHLACRALLTGECDMALAGGVNVAAGKETGYLYQEGMIFSPDGHCRAFDARAGGAVFGEGLGVVVLKRLQEAMADGDHIYAVVKGSAVNNDGMEKVSYAAPAKKGQENVIRTALEVAAVTPESISYVETHGTGTILGDPIEIEALKGAFNTAKKRYCAIGSVKTNLGHLDVAAGITGFIKTVLALKHKQLPPSLHFKTPNPNIDFENSPFYVNTGLVEWKNDHDHHYPLRAGVSSFGIGGTNAHIILEEAPEIVERGTQEQKDAGRNYHLLVLSAKTETALDKMTENLANYFKNNPAHIADAAYTLQIGRRQFKHRKVVCATAAEAAEALSTPGSEKVSQYVSPGDNKTVVFMFSGQGSQYVNMGRDLYRTEGVFRQEMDRCFELLKPITGCDIKALLYPSSQAIQNATALDRTEIAQPVIFAFEYALARLLISWGIEPKAMIGHSIGEYTAACLAGVFSLEDALTLVAVRGQLMQQMPTGAMMSIPVSEQALKPLLNEELSLAAVNGPEYCVVSGPHDAIAAFEKQLAGKYNSKRLHTSHAFHSAMMDPILENFAHQAGEITLNEPRLPLISNVSGEWLSGQDATDLAYWAKHIRATVRFSDGVQTLLKKIANAVFLEVGAGKALATFVRQHKDQQSNPLVLNLVRHPNEEAPDDYYLLNKTGQLWLYGLKINWPEFYRGEKRCRVPLPTYPFDKQRYWIEGDLFKMGADLLAQKPSSNKKNKPDDFFYLPMWKPAPSLPTGPGTGKEANGCWLVFSNRESLSTQLLERLRAANHTVITVEEGPAFAGTGEREFTLNPAAADHYVRLISELSTSGLTPQIIVHLWNMTEDSILDSETFDREQNLGFYSLIYLAQAIKKRNISADIQITVVSNHLQEVIGDEALSPGKSCLMGAIKVIPQEFPNISCRSIDVDVNVNVPGNKLLKEILSQSAPTCETVVAYRKNRRWVQTFEKVKIAKDEVPISQLRHQGIYLITGGLGGIGLILAEFLVRACAARLILISRKGPNEDVAQKLRKLEEMGGQVMVCAADVAAYEQMQDVIVQAEKRFGPINGIIHAAGVVRGKSIPCAVENLSTVECEQQFRPKVKGLLVLAKLFKDKELDFCLLTSSLASVLGGLGFAAYAAANSFMDAFVKTHNRGQVRKWLSVNWDEWQTAKQAEGFAITPAEGQEIFQRLLSWNGDADGSEETQVVVSTTELQPRIDRWIGREALAAPAQSPQQTLPGRPAVTTPYAPAQNPVEQQIAAIWQRFLGFAEIGVLDDFFELGGDSLKAMTLVSRLQKELNVSLPLVEFFNRPSIRKLAEYINKSEKITHTAIEPTEEKDYYPLSLPQKRLYVLQQLELESHAYNMPQTFRLEGELDSAVLTGIFRQLIRRHESLRTSFHLLDDEPVQKVHNSVEFEIEQIGGGTPEIIKNFIRPFDLSCAPLLRAGLVKLTENSHLLVVDMHHIISDGISHVILVKDFIALFNGRELAPLTTRYKDYAQWQNRPEQREIIKQQQAYWLEVFAGETGEIPVLNLPTDYARPETQVFDGGSFSFQVDSDYAKALNRTAQQEGVTLYMVLLAVYTVLLAKLSGQEDIVIGTPVVGRRHVDLEEIIGMFVNTLALRNYPWGGQTFNEFLHRLKERTLAAFENQDYPFEELVEQVAVNRDVSRNPLFDVMFVMQNMEFPKIEIPGLTLTTYEYEHKISKFDLTLWITEGEDRLWFTFEYCTRLFKSETIERFGGFFQELVSSILAAPGKSLAEIEMIPEEEKRRILFAFNQTGAEYPQDKAVPQLFAEQVERTPDRISVVGVSVRLVRPVGPVGPVGQVSLTYRQLNEQAAQLANVLVEKGVLADTIVGIMLERSIEMITGIFAILKAGGAYMPIDPEYPQERVNYMLKDSGAAILLTDNELTDNEKKIIVNCELLKSESRAFFHHSSRLAYVIYTSGSTGAPKGVMVEHRSVVNRLNWMQRFYPLGEKSIILQKTPISFDVSVWELFWWAFNGASVCLLGAGEQKNPQAMADAIEKNRITVIHFVPSMLNVFLEYIEQQGGNVNPGRLASLTHVFASGEALSPNHVERFNRLLNNRKHTRLINLYGPTEATVDVSYYDVPAGETPAVVPIGKPIDNIRLYILDKNQGLLPVGVPGELSIAGDGLARGYLNNPELTNKSFSGGPGGRFFKKAPLVYRTGDLARWLVGGDIEFLGRIDRQVKIRGFRVELEEIEYRLQRHEKIKEAAVVIKKDKNGQMHLCAYFVSEVKLTVTELRSYLSKELPAYMLPSFFIPLERMPLTASGKMDRGRLPEPGSQVLGSEAAFIAPRNTIEKELAGVWQKVLGLNTISIADNFFELGGDSIKAIQVVSRLKKVGLQVEMRDILRNPRIAELALSIKKTARVVDQAAVVGPVPLTPIQEWFFSNRLHSKHHYNQAVMLYSQEGFDRETVAAVFGKLQQHHDALRMTYREENGNISQYNHGEDHGDYPLSLEEHDFRGRSAAEVKAAVGVKANEIQAGIRLETGPLMKLGLFHFEDGAYLLIVIHHLVVDGISWRILFEDIDSLYRQYREGEPLTLPLKTDAFKAWAGQLHHYAGSPAFLQEKAYWAELETTPVQEIKKDFENAENDAAALETQTFNLTEEETRLLLTRVNQAFGTEINDILLTALGLAVKKVYGIERLPVALEGHGRETITTDIDISRTVGWFTSLYPVLLDISHDAGLADSIKEVKENLRRVPHKGTGYGILRYLTPAELKQDIDFRLAPQVLFNYLGQFDQDLETRTFKIASESAGTTYDKNDRREFELEVTGMITGKRLSMSVTYSNRQYKPGTLRGLWEHFNEELSHIIHYCADRETRELTPSDLTYGGLSLATLEQLQKQYAHAVEDIYTLSPMQEGMLFYSIYEDRDRPAYFEQISYRLQGELNVPLVEKSLNHLFKRHEILRTVFFYEGLNRPLQGVLRDRAVEFYFADLRRQGSKEQWVREFREQDRRRYFDLSKDVLMRVAALRLDDDEYQVIWSFHHILMDGWCVGILISEFSEIYAAALDNRETQLPPVKPYRYYIQWLEAREKEQTGAFWRNYLAGYEEPAGVPRKPAGESSAGGARFASAGTRFDKAHTAALHEIANRNHVTINTLIQTVWGIVLGKYNSRPDVVFGVLVSGRPPGIEGVETMIGCFINTIPVRIAFAENTAFNHLLRQVQEGAIAGEPHHYYPLAEIQAESPVKQHLLDHIIEFQNYPVAERIAGVGTALSNVEVFEQGNYDFYVVVYPGEQLYLSFSFNTGLYQRELVEQLGFNSLRVLEQVIGNEALPISEIAFLTEEEKHKILYEFNNRRADFPQNKTVYQFVEKHAQRTPDRTAIFSLPVQPVQPVRPVCLTYFELNERADRLARVLSARGVQADQIVGILMARSSLMVESILAVWKAGGAYLPIDPEYPQERIEYMLKDSNALVLIDEKFFGGSRGAVLQKSPPCSSNLAYIIYTSGSTGKPKGAMVEHIGMMNHMQAKIDDLRLTDKSIVAQNASHTFDISVWQFFSALITGGKTVIFPAELVLDPGKLVAHIAENFVNILEVVPSYLSILLDYLDREPMTLSLQYLLVTGEELKPNLVKKWFARYPGIKMVNAYGPTEASDDITHYIMDQAPDMERIPIGKPVQNMNIYIVDNNLQLCPIGVKGEICVAGVGVGRGYIGDEEKTKQAFREDPFSDEAGVRLYKTGDLGSWLPDGTIEFFGRKDSQVKIRGFRIELGEIENRLLAHEAVKEAVVVDKEDEQDNKYLCAYVTVQPHHAAGAVQLKEYLAERLPDYMVPAYIMPLAAIPLTPNGKIDRKALPEPEGGRSSVAYIPPRNRVEEKLAEIWAGVLGKEKNIIGIEDNFFRLGGHSLRAVTLAAKIHQALNVKLTLALLFKTPTIKELARYIKEAQEDRYTAIEPVEKRDYYELSSAQKRLYILHQMDPGSTAYNMGTVVRLPGAPDIERLEKTFLKLIARHESLRTSFHMAGNQPVQRVHGVVAFKIDNYDLQKDGAGVVAAVFQRPFNLAQAPLLKVGVIKTGDGAFVLIAVMHHIISDGVSLRILEKDFSVLYRDEVPASLRIQYKDFSQWQNNRKQEPLIKTQEDFWLNEFVDEIPVLDLYNDFPRPAVQSFEGGVLRFEVGPVETRQIKNLARQEGVTLFMLMLAATYTWLARLSGQEDIVIGTPVAGRRHADLEPVIGVFVNTLPLRACPEGGKTFREFLAEVKEKTLDAFENQEYPFEDLVEKAPVTRDTSRNPLFDVMYTLIQVDEAPGRETPRPETPRPENPTAEPPQEISEAGTAKFDLDLEMTVIETLSVSVAYSSKLFKRETIERFSAYFKQMISMIIKAPLALTSDIEIMTVQEKRQLLYDFNDTAADYPGEETIHRLFEAQASISPDRIALVGATAVETLRATSLQIQLTYRQLNMQSDRLANVLVEKGVLADTIVGIMLERSIEMITGIWAILKAGGAYLPIDPGYPEERVNYMLKDSGARILINKSEIRNPKFETNSNVQNINDQNKNKNRYFGSALVLNFEHLNFDIVSNFDIRISDFNSSNLAYLIYTSGSTGKPKGVMIEHRAVHNFIRGMTALIDFAPGKIILALTTVCFDIFLLETLLPLSRGMRVVIADEKQQADMDLLARLMIKNNIEMLQATPTRMRLFVSPGGGDKGAAPVTCLRNLKEIMVGGEAFPAKLLEDLQKITPAKIYNMYGPTETTVWSAVKNITGRQEVNIGVPIANTQIYIFNKTNQLQPIGVAGELCIGGVGLARGYLNNPELTNKSFWGSESADLFSKRSLAAGGILYRTGDLARWLPNGEIECLGRIDNQVKIRGFRIEPGEIAGHLLQHAQITGAVVAVKENSGGEKYLCAYIVITGADVATGELNNYLARSLPAYMIPAAYVKLAKIPLTSNGKLDRRALPAEEFSPGAIYRAPRNKIDEKLTEIWEQVLGMAKEVIGIDHDFFQLGGQSMKAIQFIAGANRENYNLSIIDVFKYKTIAGLADQISARQKESGVEITAGNIARKNPDFVPDTYPSYFPCVLGAVREKLRYENQLHISKGVFVVADGTAMLSLGYPENSPLKEKLKYTEFPFARRLGIFKEISEVIGYTTKLKRFSTLEKELKYCSERISKKELVLLTGTTYFLNYSPDYQMEPAQWLKKMDEIFAQYDQTKKLDLVGHIFGLVDMTGNSYILFDSTYSYYGQVPPANLHQAIKGNSAIEISKGHPSYTAYRPYQVIEVVKNSLLRKDDKELVLTTMKKFVGVTLAPEIFKRKEKDGHYVAFLGLGAIKELTRVIESSLDEKDAHDDLYRYTTTILNAWKYKYIFFRDFLLDFLNHYTLPQEILVGIEATIGHWHSLHKKIQEQKDHREELNRIFLDTSRQIAKIHDEQTLIFTKIEQALEHI